MSEFEDATFEEHVKALRENPARYLEGSRYRLLFTTPGLLKELAQTVPKSLAEHRHWDRILDSSNAEEVIKILAEKNPEEIGSRLKSLEKKPYGRDIARIVGENTGFQIFYGPSKDWPDKGPLATEALKIGSSDAAFERMAKVDAALIVRFAGSLEYLIPQESKIRPEALVTEALKYENILAPLKKNPALFLSMHDQLKGLPYYGDLKNEVLGRENLMAVAKTNYEAVFDIAMKIAGQPWAGEVLMPRTASNAQKVFEHSEWVTGLPYGRKIMEEAARLSPSSALQQAVRLLRLPYGEGMLKETILADPAAAMRNAVAIDKPFFIETIKQAAAQDPLSFHSAQYYWRDMPWAKELLEILSDKNNLMQAIARKPFEALDLMRNLEDKDDKKSFIKKEDIEAALEKVDWVKVAAEASPETIFRYAERISKLPNAEAIFTAAAEKNPEGVLSAAGNIINHPWAVNILKKAALERPVEAIGNLKTDFPRRDEILAEALRPDVLPFDLKEHKDEVIKHAKIIATQPYGEALIRSAAKGSAYLVLSKAVEMGELPYGAELIKEAARENPRRFFDSFEANEEHVARKIKLIAEGRHDQAKEMPDVLWKNQPWFKGAMEVAVASPLFSANGATIRGIVNYAKYIPNQATVKNLLEESVRQNPSGAFYEIDAIAKLPYGKDLLKMAAAGAPFMAFDAKLDKVKGKEEILAAAMGYGRLMTATETRPDEAFKHFQRYAKQPFAHQIIQAAVERDKTGESFYRHYKEIEGKIPPQQIKDLESIAASTMLRAWKSNSEAPQRIVRVINDLHNENDAIRFKSLNHLGAVQHINMIAKGREEIFTSSFNGILDSAMKRLKAQGETFLDLAKDRTVRDQLPSFFEAAASYGRIGDIFDSLPDDGARKDLLNTLFSSVSQALDEKARSGIKPPANHEKNTALRTAIALADTMMLLKSDNLRASFEEALIHNYNTATSPGLKTAYGLVASAYLKEQKTPARPELFAKTDFREKYPIQSLISLPNSAIFTNGKHIQQMAFYKEDKPTKNDDAIASYNNFIAQYKGRAGWETKDMGKFTLVSSAAGANNGRQVVIVANKPEAGYEGMHAVAEYLKETPPHVVIHRGHSYHTSKTLRLLKESTAAVFWGSCGGYQIISDTLNRSPDAHILATKSVGTMQVNDPLFRMINEQVLKTGSINWSNLWADATKSVGDKRFKDYVPPDKNFGALFVHSYDKIMDQQKAELSLQRRAEAEPAPRIKNFAELHGYQSARSIQLQLPPLKRDEAEDKTKQAAKAEPADQANTKKQAELGADKKKQSEPQAAV